jgi:two-component SAPR family response regulator
MWNYDFILLDIRMAPINGIELYKKIRESDKNVRVFIFTATNPNFGVWKNKLSRVGNINAPFKLDT